MDCGDGGSVASSRAGKWVQRVWSSCIVTTIEEIKRTPDGAKAIAELFGDGVPVARDLAEHRAFICEYCPYNVSAGWWNKTVSKIAEAIKAMLEVKHRLDLKTSNEDALKMCKVCGCAVPLIVWSPLALLRKRMKPGELASYPEACWKRTPIPDDNETI
jgi:hypothetical protein